MLVVGLGVGLGLLVGVKLGVKLGLGVGLWVEDGVEVGPQAIVNKSILLVDSLSVVPAPNDEKKLPSVTSNLNCLFRFISSLNAVILYFNIPQMYIFMSLKLKPLLIGVWLKHIEEPEIP